MLVTKDEVIFATDSRYELDAIEQLSGQCSLFFGDENQIHDKFKEVIKEKEISVLGIEENYITMKEYFSLSSTFKNCEMVNCGNDILMLRLIKTDEEIAKIEIAQKISSEAFAKVLPLIKVGVSEKDIALELEYIMAKLGGEGLSFDTIVASGVNSAMPHAKPTDKKICYGDIVLLDYGAKYKGYCSDISRTVCVGKSSETFDDLYDIVKKAQEYAINNIKAGMTCLEADSYARELIKANNFAEEFSHSLGHGVGLEAHENPRVSYKSDGFLRENMVITVEPGIYIKDVGGVRIEDVIVVKNDKSINLTTAKKDKIILT